ncbi:hypothetical protein ACFFLE_03865 [Salinicoccus siamensis]|uniref:O-antigen ligase-like membrane protein n=2 Tax=Salinicoccus siamensis TaxID=381830 RepID=A0ABV5Z5G1_9STAP
MTSGRYEVWKVIWDNRQFFGEGHAYIEFTELLHAHNIFLDTVGRYGLGAAILLALILCITFLLAFIKGMFNTAIYLAVFTMVGMFEYNYLFMFTYFSPIILLFLLFSRIITVYEESGAKLHDESADIK